MKLPALNTTTEVLLNLYLNYQAIGSKEIRENFKVSRAGAYRILDYCEEYMLSNGMTPSLMSGRRTVPIGVFFKCYGFNIEDIINKVKLMKSINNL